MNTTVLHSVRITSVAVTAVLLGVMILVQTPVESKEPDRFKNPSNPEVLPTQIRIGTRCPDGINALVVSGIVNGLLFQAGLKTDNYASAGEHFGLRVSVECSLPQFGNSYIVEAAFLRYIPTLSRTLVEDDPIGVSGELDLAAILNAVKVATELALEAYLKANFDL